MEDSSVIRRVTEPTDWVSNLAYSHKKGGDLRVCLDPTHLNKFLKRPHHRTPTVEELTLKFSGAGQSLPKAGRQIRVLVSTNPLRVTAADHLPVVHLWKILLSAAAPSASQCQSQDIFRLKMDQILEQVDGTVGQSVSLTASPSTALWTAKDDTENDLMKSSTTY